MNCVGGILKSVKIMNSVEIMNSVGFGLSLRL